MRWRTSRSASVTMSASFRAPRRHRIKKVCSHRSRTIARAGVLPGPTAASCTATARLPWVFLPIALTGFALNQSFGLTITLGQDYLPSRIGTSSGVTLGLPISIEHQVPARRMMGLRPHHQPEDSDSTVLPRSCSRPRTCRTSRCSDCWHASGGARSASSTDSTKATRSCSSSPRPANPLRTSAARTRRPSALR